MGFGARASRTADAIERRSACGAQCGWNGAEHILRQPLPLGSRVEMSMHLGTGVKPIGGYGSVVRMAGANQMGIQTEHWGVADSERLGEFLLPLVQETL